MVSKKFHFRWHTFEMFLSNGLEKGKKIALECEALAVVVTVMKDNPKLEPIQAQALGVLQNITLGANLIPLLKGWSMHCAMLNL